MLRVRRKTDSRTISGESRFREASTWQEQLSYSEKKQRFLIKDEEMLVMVVSLEGWAAENRSIWWRALDYEMFFWAADANLRACTHVPLRSLSELSA